MSLTMTTFLSQLHLPGANELNTPDVLNVIGWCPTPENKLWLKFLRDLPIFQKSFSWVRGTTLPLEIVVDASYILARSIST